MTGTENQAGGAASSVETRARDQDLRDGDAEFPALVREMFCELLPGTVTLPKFKVETLALRSRVVAGGGDGEGCGGAIGAADGVADGHGKLGAAVGSGHRGSRIGGQGCAGDGRAVFLPLIVERRGAGDADLEGGGLTRGDDLTGGLGGDAGNGALRRDCESYQRERGWR